MNAENAAMTPAAENAVVETATESIGTRFTKKVLAQFASNTGSQIAVTEFQRRLIQGYFIQIDRAWPRRPAWRRTPRTGTTSGTKPSP